MATTVLVVNLDKINNSIRLSGKLYAAAMHNALVQGAEPIRQDAGRLSQLELSGMKRAKIHPPPWSVQRKGQTVHSVYIAPSQRGRHGRDTRTEGARRRATRFVELMMGKAYEPALERNEARLRVYVDNWLGKVTREI